MTSLTTFRSLGSRAVRSWAGRGVGKAARSRIGKNREAWRSVIGALSLLARFQFPHPEVIEGDLALVPAKDAELDAGLLDAEVLARRPQGLLPLDSRDHLVALVFDQQGVPLPLL